MYLPHITREGVRSELLSVWWYLHHRREGVRSELLYAGVLARVIWDRESV
jgi:hypothetical protein